MHCVVYIGTYMAIYICSYTIIISYCLFADHRTIRIPIIIEHADMSFIKYLEINCSGDNRAPSSPVFHTPYIECDINNNNTANQNSIHAQQSRLMVCAPEQCGDRVNLVSITFNPFSPSYRPSLYTPISRVHNTMYCRDTHFDTAESD